MNVEVNVIKEGNVRRADYEGNYALIEDKGDTMIIRAEIKTEEEINMLKKRVTDSEDITVFLMTNLLGGY